MIRGRALRSFVSNEGTFQAGRVYEGDVVADRPHLFEALEPVPKARAKPVPKGGKADTIEEPPADPLPPQD